MADQLVGTNPQGVPASQPGGAEGAQGNIDVAKIQAEAEAKAMERYKGMQRTLSKVQDQLKQTQEQLDQYKGTDISSLLEVLEVQAKESGDPAISAKIAELKAVETERQRKMTMSQRYAEQRAISNAERDKLEERIRAAGGDPDDPKFDRVFTEWKSASMTNGDFSEANRLLDKRLGTTTQNTEAGEKGATDGALRAQIEREVIAKYGLTGKEPVPASMGAGGAQVVMTREQIRRMTPQEYAALTKAGKHLVQRG